MSAAAAAVSSSKPANNMAVKLKRKRTTTEYDGPVLMRLPHGPPPHLTKPELKDDIDFKLYANPDDRKNFQRILLASTPGVVYAGQNFGTQQSFRANTNQYAIGVFDATKNKVKIVSCNHVYRMEQHVRALDGLDASVQGDNEDTYQTQQRVLADTFGSKKTQKRLASRAANQVTVQESTSQVLTHAVSTIQPNQDMAAEDDLLEDIRQTVLPRYNESAESVRDIYPVDSVLPTAVADALGPNVKAWRAVIKKGAAGVKKDAKSDTPLTTSSFILNRLEALAALDKSDDRDQVLKLLIYVNLLLAFRNGGRNKKKLVGEWGEELCASDRVKEQLLADFTVVKSIGPPEAQAARQVFDGSCEQKLLCHIAVGTLLCANFTLDAEMVDAMSQDMKMMTSDMLKYYAEAGCSVSKSRIHLSAPLKLPKLRKKIERK